DFEIVFKTVDNSATPKRAYRSTAPDSLGLILLVHDFASTGASVSGAKFAKVGVVSAMMDIDTITGQQMPFNPSIPNANWEYSNTSHGWAKWYYKVSNPTNNDMSLETRDSSSPSNSISPFVISGNNLGFGLQIGITSLDFYASYGFLQFYDETIGRENIVLLAFGVNSRKTQASYILTANRCSLALSTISNPNETYTGDPTPNLKGVIWFDRNGNMNYKLLGQPFHYQHLRSSEVIASYNSSTQDIVINDAEGYSRGVLPFLKFQTGALKTGRTIDIIDSFNFSATTLTSNGAFIRSAISLESS
ncbi:hypothetical protein KTJ54_12060, partial [Acinetobacter radioresistens]|nr:hypothetical protein [Acinetobacter radioresistens]